MADIIASLFKNMFPNQAPNFFIIKNNNPETSFIDYLNEYPPIFRFTDSSALESFNPRSCVRSDSI